MSGALRRFALIVLCGLMAGTTASVASAQQALRLEGVEITPAASGDEVSLLVSQAVQAKTFFLSGPDRFVIDIPAAKSDVQAGLPAGYAGGWVRNLRVGAFNPTTTRVVVELAAPMQLADHVVQARASGAALKFTLRGSGAAPAPVASPFTAAPAQNDWTHLAERKDEVKPLPAGVNLTVVPLPVFKPTVRTQKPIIVIDAGHGGRDPGAIGSSGTHEKEVTLAYARALSKELLRTGRYHVVMTRDEDTFIMLRDRMAVGRKAKGDIFISLHADSAENKDTRGFSIYTLSNNASDAEAAALAARENKVDLVYGLNLSDEQQDVTEILIDLAQRETMNKSSKLADILVANLAKDVNPLPNTHRYAGFAVLKAPDVPSVLVEIGFLSNRHDEKQIKTEDYRRKVVTSLVRGMDAYFQSRKQD